MSVEHRVPEAMETCACPLCGSREAGKIVGTRGRFGVAVTNVVCPVCALVYVNPRPTREAMAAYYAEEYRPHFEARGVGYVTQAGTTVTPDDPAFDAEKEAWHESQARTSWLLSRMRRGMRVLEVGCRHGRTLALQRERYGIEPFGIEPDRTEAAKARAAGIECHAGVLEEFEPGARRFDVIQIFHVLEHLHDPLDALLRFRSWLEPQGKLVIEVPNVHQPYGSLEGNFFQNAHLTSLSADTLEALLFRAGFRPIQVLDRGVLLIVAELDELATDVPRPYALAPREAKQDADWVHACLRSYAELFDLALRIQAGSFDLADIERAAALYRGPCFTAFALESLAPTVEALARQGAPRTALHLARALAEGPQPDDARGAVLHLVHELTLLVVEHERARPATL
ncbi:MAG: class I SAM-dependent methyltransferase [Polyangiaceae bacterium]